MVTYIVLVPLTTFLCIMIQAQIDMDLDIEVYEYGRLGVLLRRSITKWSSLYFNIVVSRERIPCYILRRNDFHITWRPQLCERGSIRDTKFQVSVKAYPEVFTCNLQNY